MVRVDAVAAVVLVASLLAPALPAASLEVVGSKAGMVDELPCDARGLAPTLGCEVWAARWDGPYSSDGPIDRRADEDTKGIVASDDGDLVIVSGRTPASPEWYEGVAIALDGKTGETLWTHTFERPSDVRGVIWEPAISPDGDTVYLGGEGANDADEHVALIRALDAETGGTDWEYTFKGAADHPRFYDLGLSPDGSKVFATGPAQNRILTVALDASDGSLLWKDLYDHPDAALRANHVVVSPDGEQVAVAGWLVGDHGVLMRAFDADTGTVDWTSVIPEINGDRPVGFEYSQDSDRLFVVKVPTFSGPGQKTFALDAQTGQTLWSHKFHAEEVAVDPANELVYVTRGRASGLAGLVGLGLPGDPTRSAAFVTVAFDQETGEEMWRSIYEVPGHLGATALDVRVSPDGRCVYASGSAGDASGRYAMLYVMDASDGDSLWAARYNGPSHDNDVVYVGAVAKDTGGLFLAGETDGDYRLGGDILALKYDDPCPLT